MLLLTLVTMQIELAISGDKAGRTKYTEISTSELRTSGRKPDT